MIDIEAIKKERRWHDKCLLIFMFHTHHLVMNGSMKRGRRWRLEDTSFELGLSIGFVSESLTIARYTDKLSLSECESREAAIKKCREYKSE